MTEKKVFISHSSKDYKTAKRLCDIFEEQGLQCWLAPRDIPYGVEWAETIVKGIRSSGMIIVLITKYSISSKQVIREINTAIQNDLMILPLKLDSTPLSDGLRYYLDIFQNIDMSDELTDTKIYHLISYIKKHYLGDQTKLKYTHSDFSTLPEQEDTSNNTEYTTDYMNHPFTLEEELSNMYENTFSYEMITRSNSEPIEYSPFRKKIMKRLCDKIVNEMVTKTIKATNQILPLETQGFHFSITESEGFTMAFIQKPRISEKTFDITYQLERLKYYEEKKKDGNKIVTFFCVDTESYDNAELLLVTILKEKDIALINTGCWNANENIVKIGNSPTIMSLELLDDGKVRFLSKTKSNFLIIDPMTQEIVEPKQYYDKNNMRNVNIMELSSHHLIAIRLTPLRQRKATNYELGIAYFFGKRGLNKNWLKAAEYFDLDGSPKSSFYLGKIFSEDPLLSNEEDARYYFQIAHEGGILN